jgi:hypothetical protein
MKSARTILLSGVAAATLLAGIVAIPVHVAALDGPARQAAKGELRQTHIHAGGQDRAAPTLSGSTVEAAKAALQDEARDTTSATASAASGSGPLPGSLGCSGRNPDGNVRVNQDCTFRRQAEEVIKANPTQPDNLIAGQNDSRVGFNRCGFAFSLDGGRTWGDGQPPFFQRLNNPASVAAPAPGDPNRHSILGGPGTLHTYDAASDPAVAFDSQGRAFYSCLGFDVNSAASGLFVTQSPQGAQGSFYDNLAASGRRFVVAEDNSAGVFHDKEFITADVFTDSPNRDNVYVTWTVFFFNARCVIPVINPSGYCSSPIFGSMSTDHALHWSTPEEISAASSSLCFFGNFFDSTRPANSCDFDQGSDPVVLPDGRIAVIFNNGNTAATNPNLQQLAVLCHPSGSTPAGTARLNCGAPIKVGDDVVVGEPQCDFGRGPEECIPGAFIRTNDFPRLAEGPDGILFAGWQDYRNGQFDIQLARSDNGGLSWRSASASVNPDSGRDHYFPAVAVATTEGNDQTGSVAVSYYRTDRIPNENTTPAGGFAPCSPAQGGSATCQPGVGAEPSVYQLAGGSGLRTPFAARTVSPSFVPPDGIQTGFNGDYSGLVVVGQTAHPIWSDTRNAVPTGIQSQSPAQGVTHDEDIFTDALPIPGGNQGQQG